MRNLKSQRLSVGVAASALIVGLAFSASLLATLGNAGRESGGTTHLMVSDLAGEGEYTLEETRALKEAVFVGQVVWRDHEVDIGEEGFPFLLPVYAVEVETWLKGGMHEPVRVAVMEFDAPEEYGGHRIVVGDRYLFAAQGPDEGLLWVDEGLGSLRITDDHEAAAIIAEYRQWIEHVEQMPTPVPDEEPCGWLVGNPTIDIDPNEGRAGRSVRVTAKRVMGPMVHVYWRNLNNRVGKNEVRPEDCATNVQIDVPRDARPGRYDVIIVDARGLQASERFHVID